MKSPTKFHTHKSVSWSYPTSDNATRFFFYARGCWTVALEDPSYERAPVYLSGHATEAEAMREALAMPQPWMPLFLRYHPEAA